MIVINPKLWILISWLRTAVCDTYTCSCEKCGIHRLASHVICFLCVRLSQYASLSDCLRALSHDWLLFGPVHMYSTSSADHVAFYRKANESNFLKLHGFQCSFFWAILNNFNAIQMFELKPSCLFIKSTMLPARYGMATKTELHSGECHWKH
jgi:hypothetical protein